jgi:hypothetical protein
MPRMNHYIHRLATCILFLLARKMWSNYCSSSLSLFFHFPMQTTTTIIIIMRNNTQRQRKYIYKADRKDLHVWKLREDLLNAMHMVCAINFSVSALSCSLFCAKCTFSVVYLHRKCELSERTFCARSQKYFFHIKWIKKTQTNLVN